jgi:hypothetical protein
MSQQSMNDIENLKKILEDSGTSNTAFKPDFEEDIYSIIDPEAAMKVLDERSLIEQGSMEIDQNELMRAIKILENRQ